MSRYHTYHTKAQADFDLRRQQAEFDAMARREIGDGAMCDPIEVRVVADRIQTEEEL